jgi:Mg-chelatase subunit ChlI
VGIAVLARPRAFSASFASARQTTRVTPPAVDQARTAILVLRAARPGRSDDARAETAAAASRAEAAAAGSRAEAAAARARAAVLARTRPLGSPQAASIIGPSGLGQAALR